MCDESGAARFHAALSGAVPVPPARGLSFVGPKLLPRAGRAPHTDADALVAACVDLRLDFAFVPSWSDWSAAAVAGLQGEGVAALWVVPGVVAVALDALGVERGLRDSVRDPERMSKAMEVALVAALAAAARGLELGADVVVVADDMAGGGGPLLDPGFLRDRAFPLLAHVAALVASAGAPALLHCDGDARTLMPAAAEAGFAALHGDGGGAEGLERSRAAALAVGLAWLGGIPTSGLTGAAAGALAGALAAKWAAGGGLLVCDDGGVSSREQVVALFSALEAAGRR
jgi:hypothetical protein